MELKRGKLATADCEQLKFKNGMSTLLCSNGLVYLLTDQILQECANQIDTLPAQQAMMQARSLFGSAMSARVNKRGYVIIKDAPKALEILSTPFERVILKEGLAVLVPQGADLSSGLFFKKEIEQYRKDHQ
jgi:hypothetical protein